MTQLLAQLGLNRRQFIDPPLASRTEQRSPSIAECKEPRSPLLGLGASGGAGLVEVAAVGAPAATVGDASDFLDVDEHHVPGQLRGDRLRGLVVY
ncbi:hypothetical protein [Streptomyces sp. NPDC056663]|uniref:hypothetical protein n=1 Tax=Streptomyces sp. NPDC056663 TaxID=3345899 RepID=UPI003679ACA2